MEWENFNINSYVRVKLTDEGHTVLKAFYGQFNQDYKKILTFEDGWYIFQLWMLMSIFGDKLCNGCNNMFDTNIQIQRKD